MDNGDEPIDEPIVHAHSLPGRPEAEWETLATHLADVARRAAHAAASFGAGQIAAVAGLLHDIGKCSAEYQAYIRDKGASPDHSSAGAIEAVRLFGGDPAQALLARLLAFAVAGHHAGLADGSGATAASLDSRLAKAVPAYPGWQGHAIGLPDGLALTSAFKGGRDGGFAYSLAFLGRMLFSCLVDADFLATEAFYLEHRGEASERGGHASLETLAGRLDRHLAGLMAKADETPLNRLRAEILDHARRRAACDPGLFTMTVPTGGGKTLASLAFALDHANRHGLRRVIYVIPYTGARIETQYPTASKGPVWSPPTRGRGSKPALETGLARMMLSPRAGRIGTASRRRYRSVRASYSAGGC